MKYGCWCVPALQLGRLNQSRPHRLVGETSRNFWSRQWTEGGARCSLAVAYHHQLVTKARDPESYYS